MALIRLCMPPSSKRTTSTPERLPTLQDFSRLLDEGMDVNMPALSPK
ncbi:BRCA1-associated RING domain protein 1-like [Iris pallida]|uniref:BRCA1-associated RING domain protein 1-like n=1 Tax=Iris pallida TaxID=29817 RepID=A0AAX6G6N9_IRIPA|nr:BRCA1-associated RING domain protein 1-like [Iris pallida]KAJ6824404.1 BRCA1-associated RING domain protein 1-like [Iris pallida]